MNNPSPEDLATWHRYFGIEANNRAWQLTEQPTRTEAENAEMLATAHSAAWHWAAVGTPHNTALGQMLLGQVHALLGQGGLALQFARASHAFVMTNESQPWETAFAHAILAHAAAAAGDRATHVAHYLEAKALGEALPEQQDREIFDATFRRIPAPAAG